MRVVNIEFTRSTKTLPLFGWAIQAIQRTKYSHVRLAWFGAGGQIPVIYEASGSNLKFIGPIAARYHNQPKIIKSYPFKLNPEQYRALVKLCMENAGVDYGKKQVIGIGLAYALRLKKNPFADGRRSQVCSEIVGSFLEKILGWDTGLDLDIAGPREIQETIEKHGVLTNV